MIARVVLVMALAIWPFAATAQSDETARIGVEFNNLQQTENGCRAVFVLNNGMPTDLEQLTLRIVAFDANEHATLFLSLDAGRLPERKTRVLRFELGEGSACDGFSRFLLDDVIACQGGDLDAAACLDAVDLSSRGPVPFDY